MRHHLNEFFCRNAVPERIRDMEIHLFVFARRNQRGTSDQTAIAFRELRSFLNVAEQYVLRQIDELRREAAQRFGYRALWFAIIHHDLSHA
jgi:sarcosine oxidase delta subunit